MLKFLYITNQVPIAKIAMGCGIERIFVDLETIGKSDRQGGLNTVQSKHSIEDIVAIRAVIKKDCELLVRSNPLHEGSIEEINQIVESGADIIMLPYFTTAEHVKIFVENVASRAKVCILLENKESAIDNLDEILQIQGVDEYYVGLNDLHLSLGGKFMFEPMANGILDTICTKLRATGKPFGFGGIARLGGGTLPAERVIAEHYRLGSTRAIISRTFCNTSIVIDPLEICEIMNIGIEEIRAFEKEIMHGTIDLNENHQITISLINQIVNG